jgi:hypothetical protein
MTEQSQVRNSANSDVIRTTLSLFWVSVPSCLPSTGISIRPLRQFSHRPVGDGRYRRRSDSWRSGCALAFGVSGSESLERQLERVMRHLDAKSSDLERYII